LPCRECRAVSSLVVIAFMLVALLMGAYAIHRDGQLMQLEQRELGR
jgi:uncharacterized membrane protein affecting hemolysin expression